MFMMVMEDSERIEEILRELREKYPNQQWEYTVIPVDNEPRLKLLYNIEEAEIAKKSLP